MIEPPFEVAMARLCRLTARALTAGMTLAALAGCPVKPEGPLRVGTNAWIGFEPLFLARDLGRFGDAEVRLQELPSASAIINAFRSRSLDAAALTLDEALLLLQDGIDIRVTLVFDASNGADALVAQREIRTLADLRGKRIGVESSALGAYMLARALDRGGLTPGVVQPVPVSFDRHEEVFRAGQVDAVVTYEPALTRLLARGAVVLFDSSQVPGEVVDVLVVHADALRTRGPALERLAEDFQTAVEYFRAHPADGSSRMARRLGIAPAEVQKALGKVTLATRADNARLLRGTTPGLLEPAGRLARIMLETNLLQRTVDPAQMLGGPVRPGVR